MNIIINEFVASFTSLVQNISFSSFGKQVCIPSRESMRSTKSVWFDSKCKEAKASFYHAKRRYARRRSDVDKILFLQERSPFCKVKRNAKFRYQNTKKLKLSDLSQNSPSKLWSYINKFQNSNQECKYTLLCIDQLDRPFTEEEIKKTISCLKRNKSPDFENIVADFFSGFERFHSTALRDFFPVKHNFFHTSNIRNS